MTEPAALQPIAKVYGEPVLEVPHDLYIPPDALEVVLEQFEGPLDLLLYLIRRENINVLDIPMARLTAQYLDYVELMRARSLELAAEYLLMAALLIEIKSRMLLPRPAAGTLEEDPRAELVRRLLEYERMKLAAQRLNELPQSGRDYSMVQVLFDQAVAERLPDVRAEDLRAAWLTLLTRAAMNRHHRITREQLSVREHMTRILRRLHDTRFIEFGKLFDPRQGIAVLVVTLLAVLELAREGLIEVTQQAAYTPIHVRLKTGHLTAVE
ncbi:MAG TPA: ScpA family protein [Burkholderiales bacterium]|jgi:segregation and condensation protein A